MQAKWRKPFVKPGNSFTVGAHYSKATGISLLQGRDFDPVRDDQAPVVIVNQALASRVFGDVSAIGRHIQIEQGERAGKSYEVIGVALFRRK